MSSRHFRSLLKGIDLKIGLMKAFVSTGLSYWCVIKDMLELRIILKYLFTMTSSYESGSYIYREKKFIQMYIRVTKPLHGISSVYWFNYKTFRSCFQWNYENWFKFARKTLCCLRSVIHQKSFIFNFLKI